MKIIKYFKILILGVIVLATSCSDSWLETTPTGSASSDEVVGTTENIKQAINGICKLTTMQHSYYGQGFNGEGTIMLYYGEYLGQDFYFPYMAPDWAVMMNGLLTQQPARLYTHYPWYYYYAIIGNANTILDNIDSA
ncbi:hypothetical protein LJB84_02625 [Bacteroidales bacterium OttesenSCG-928-J19]|nr:hypothetical protein [Bacteroidales bacterium OttesenSCG-928-J19]